MLAEQAVRLELQPGTTNIFNLAEAPGDYEIDVPFLTPITVILTEDQRERVSVTNDGTNLLITSYVYDTMQLREVIQKISAPGVFGTNSPEGHGEVTFLRQKTVAQPLQ